MNFKGNHKPPALPIEPRLNMADLAKRIEDVAVDDDVVKHYAPPAIRNAAVPPDAPVIEHIAKFGELPTKELDDIITAAEEEIANLKRDAQAVRDLYSKYTTRLTEDIKRLREGVRLSMETMQTLRNQCVALDNNLQKLEVKAE